LEDKALLIGYLSFVMFNTKKSAAASVYPNILIYRIDDFSRTSSSINIFLTVMGSRSFLDYDEMMNKLLSLITKNAIDYAGIGLWYFGRQ
jgi:hypothetical protein